MKYFESLIMLITSGAAVASLQNVIEYEMGKLVKKEEVKIESLLRNLEPASVIKGPVRVKAANWTDCGGSYSLATINSLSIDSLIKEPGTFHVSTSVNVKSTLDSLKGNLTFEKKVLGKYVKLPCIDNIGSCTYDDLCGLLSQISQCPDQLVKAGLNCHCPVKPKTYSLSNAEFEIDAAVMPAGDYHFILSVTKADKIAICLDIYLSFE